MAISSLITAWDLEFRPADAEIPDFDKKVNDLASKENVELDDTLKFANHVVENLYPKLINHGKGSVEKNNMLYEFIDREKVTEIATDLKNSLDVLEKEEADLQEALDKQKTENSFPTSMEKPKTPIKIIKHDGPIWNSTPTEMQNEFGVRFNPEGESELDYLKRRAVNVMDMLHDLQRFTSNQEQKEKAVEALHTMAEGLDKAIEAFTM